jgi:hypothetical protein
MKKILTLFAIFALALACDKIGKEPEKPDVPDVPEETDLIITATAITPGNTTWQAGNTFIALLDGKKEVEFTLKSGEGQTEGVFEAKLEKDGAADTTKWFAFLGKGEKVVKEADDPEGTKAKSKGTITIPDPDYEFHCSFMGQEGCLGKINNFNFSKAKGDGLTPVFDFSQGEKLTYILEVIVPAGIKCIEYTPSASYVVDTSEVSTMHWFNKNDENDYSAKNTSTITFETPSKAGDVVYIAVPAINYSRTLDTFNNGKQNGNLKAAVVITIMNDVSDEATKSIGTVFEENLIDKGGEKGSVDLSESVLLDRPKPSEALTFTAANISFVHPSRKQTASSLTTKWAPFNLGASKNSEKGGYYSFGESFSKATPEEFTFVNYTMRHKPNGKDNYDDVMTGGPSKVVDNADNGDWWTVASSRYDAARVNWGSAWRMPRMVEAKALIDETTITRENATVDGQTGIKFTNSGNELFFPHSGFFKEGDAKEQDYVEFWTADKINRSHSDAGWNQAYGFWLKLNADNTVNGGGIDRFSHYCGLCVRAVLVSSVIE